MIFCQENGYTFPYVQIKCPLSALNTAWHFGSFDLPFIIQMFLVTRNWVWSAALITGSSGVFVDSDTGPFIHGVFSVMEWIWFTSDQCEEGRNLS